MKPQIKWALAAAAVLLVGFISVQQTGALWRSDAASDGGGTITAGTLKISAGADGTQNFTLDELKLTDASPGDSVQKALPVINSGNVTMSYQLNSVVVTGDVGMLLRVSKVDSPADCTGTNPGSEEIYTGPMDTAAFGGRNVTAGQTEVLCLRATIDGDAPAGKESRATFTFGASSVSSS